jgi:hypothetical protein
MPDNSRRHRRLPASCRLFIELLAPEPGSAERGEHLACESRDLSRQGLSLRLPRPLQVGAVHQLGIEFFSREQPLFLVGEIRWCEESSAQPGVWEAGFALLSSRDTDMAEWQSLLQVLDKEAG